LKPITTIFASNQTSTEVTIPIQNDNVLESMEMFKLTLVIPKKIKGNGVVKGALSTAVVSIIDDDSKLTVYHLLTTSVKLPSKSMFNHLSYLAFYVVNDDSMQSKNGAVLH